MNVSDWWGMEKFQAPWKHFHTLAPFSLCKHFTWQNRTHPTMFSSAVTFCGSLFFTDLPTTRLVTCTSVSSWCSADTHNIPVNPTANVSYGEVSLIFWTVSKMWWSFIVSLFLWAHVNTHTQKCTNSYTYIKRDMEHKCQFHYFLFLIPSIRLFLKLYMPGFPKCICSSTTWVEWSVSLFSFLV